MASLEDIIQRLIELTDAGRIVWSEGSSSFTGKVGGDTYRLSWTNLGHEPRLNHTLYREPQDIPGSTENLGTSSKLAGLEDAIREHIRRGVLSSLQATDS